MNDNFSYEVWAKPYHDLLLNKDAVISTLQNATVVSDTIFVRPVLDNKSFNGKVMSAADFLKIQNDSNSGVKNAPSPDTMILISPPKKIGQEHRHYVVDGEIVTSSRYKFNGQPSFAPGCDRAVLDVAREAIARWTPARAFVLDTYISGSEIGLVEIGCIGHAGLYEADLIKLAGSIDQMAIDAQAAPMMARSSKPFHI